MHCGRPYVRCSLCNVFYVIFPTMLISSGKIKQVNKLIANKLIGRLVGNLYQ
jgi:hypothetical protein